MEWSRVISEALEYIEKNITEDISIDDIAKQVHISAYYFQKGLSQFSIKYFPYPLC